MQTITTPEGLNALENGNKFIGTLPTMKKSKITFNGENNILYCDDDVVLTDCNINFNGSNSVVFLSSSKKYIMHIYINNDSAMYIGKGTTFNKLLHFILSERKHIFVGDDCMFSLDIWMRNGEPHLIYDEETRMRKNLSKSIFLGDHVWLGQHALILKGTKIHSGSIVAAGSIVAGKTISSNESWAGIPSKKIADKLFWDRPSVHTYTEKQTANSMRFKDDRYIYKYNKKQYIPFEEIDAEIDSLKSAEEKFKYLMTIHDNTDKNRFSYRPMDAEPEPESKPKFSLFGNSKKK